MNEIRINTRKHEEMIDITEKVVEFVKMSGIKDGICIVYSPHTTAGITINENADPDVKSDMLKSLKDIVKEIGFEHSEGNSAAHVKTSILGKSQTLIINDSRLVLGTWDGIYLCEFDGPRERSAYIEIISK